jgi:hypothetical protein
MLHSHQNRNLALKNDKKTRIEFDKTQRQCQHTGNKPGKHRVSFQL